MKFLNRTFLTGILLSVSTYAVAGIDEFDLNYGGKITKFTKSKSLIAVKPHRGKESELNSLLAETENTIMYDSSKLAGFLTLKARDANTSDAELDNLRKKPFTINVGTHVFHTSNDNVPFVPTGSIYIKFKKEADSEECSELLGKCHLKIMDIRGSKKLIVRTTKQSPNPLKVAKKLQDERNIVSIAEPEFSTFIKRSGFELPKDELLKDQWHLKNNGFCRNTSIGLKVGADAGVVDAWESMESLGNPDIKIAIIDDGFDLRHPDLSGDRVIFPWDFIRNNNHPFPDYTKEWRDGDWHGTACAGVALGNEDGGKIIGAAPKAKFIPIRWGGDLSDEQVENWFGYAADKGADIVSCSWGAAARNYPLPSRQSDAIRKAAKHGRNGKGCIIFFAAGNEDRNINDLESDSVNGFAIHPKVIAVAASTSRDERSDYSNYGEEIAFTAPSSGAGGMGILTSDVEGSGRRGYYGYSPTDYTYDFGGTSSATPLAAGIGALVLSVNPDLTRKEVKDILQRSARKIGGDVYDEKGFSPKYGYGCINAKAAVVEAKEVGDAKAAVGEAKKLIKDLIEKGKEKVKPKVSLI